MALADLQPLADKPLLSEAERDSILSTPEARATFDPVSRTVTWWPLVKVGKFKYLEQPVEKAKPWERKALARSTYYKSVSKAELSRKVDKALASLQEVREHLDRMASEGEADTPPPL